MSKPLSRTVAAPPPLREIRVIIIDDSAMARTSLARLLQTRFALRIVGQAEDGLNGLALVERLEPDLVVTDLHMPGLDGLQLVELLRQKFPAIRSIITSDHDGPVVQAISRRQGADAFITKQHLAEELPCLLRRLFPGALEPANQKANS